MPASKKKQKIESTTDKVIVAVPGNKGSFSHNAAEYHFAGDRDVEITGCRSFRQVFELVESGKAKYGVVPAESSMSGTLQNTNDLLIQFHLFIVGECAREEKHCLLGHKDATINDVRKVYSHPHLHMQCDNFLGMFSDPVERLCVSDSTKGCEKVKELDDKECAAIASPEAAEVYDLQVLKQSISNYSPMITRYIIISAKQALLSNPRAPKKTTICISMGNAPGTIHRVVACFGFRDINIVRMESRPSSTALEMYTGPSLKHWDYVYHIDYEPSADQTTNEKLLDNLKEYCLTVRNFGTYMASVPQTELLKNVLLASPTRHGRSDVWGGENASLFI